MILCPICNDDQELQNLSCSQCGHQVKIVDGTPFFHPDAIEKFNDHTPESLVSIEDKEHTHFWFQTRFNFINYVFNNYVQKNDRCIEIGGGTGGVSSFLNNHGYQLAIGEIQPEGLKFAKEKNIKERYQFDLYKPIFKEEFDCIGIFDVLEHLEDEGNAVKSLSTILKKNGKIILTVPAHQWLWNRRDIIENHKRRYEISDLKKLFTENGFDIIFSRYFFVSILPLLVLRSFLSKSDNSPVTESERLSSLEINPLINRILSLITSFENKILRYFSLPFGGSIILVAQKREPKN